MAGTVFWHCMKRLGQIYLFTADTSYSICNIRFYLSYLISLKLSKAVWLSMSRKMNRRKQMTERSTWQQHMHYKVLTECKVILKVKETYNDKWSNRKSEHETGKAKSKQISETFLNNIATTVSYTFYWFAQKRFSNFHSRCLFSQTNYIKGINFGGN